MRAAAAALAWVVVVVVLVGLALWVSGLVGLG